MILVIPRYYYLGSTEDTMRDPRTLRLQSSFKDAYKLKAHRDDPPILLMWGHNFDLLAAKDITLELYQHESWYDNELKMLREQYTADEQFELGSNIGMRQSALLARKYAYQRLSDQASMHLDNIAFKVLEMLETTK